MMIGEVDIVGRFGETGDLKCSRVRKGVYALASLAKGKGETSVLECTSLERC